MPKRSERRIEGLRVNEFAPNSGQAAARLVLCHGAWVGGWIWDDFAAYLADRGFSCVVPTLRGHDDSAPVSDLGKVSILDYVRDVLTVYDAVGGDVLVGESAGGLVALKAAEAHPGVKALVLMNPAPPFMAGARPKLLLKQAKYLPALMFSKPQRLTERDYKALILNNVPEPEATEWYKRTCDESGRAMSEMAWGKIKIDPDKLHCPVYLVIGHLDEILPVKVHRRTAELLAAEVVEYPQMSHHTFSEQGWEKVADEMIGWLSPKLVPAG